MEKILFVLDATLKEGFTATSPLCTKDIPSDSIDEIEGIGVLEKVPSLIYFIEEVYRILRVGSKATFNAPYYASSSAWVSPLNVRGICEASLNFSSKEWRETAKYTEANLQCNFEVAASFTAEQDCTQRSEVAKNFWLRRYNNVIQSVQLTITKK